MDNKDKAASSNEQQPQKISYTIAPNNELRVRNVSAENMRRLFNVAKWQGISAGTLVKLHIKDILAKYPPEYQNEPPSNH